MLSRRNLRVKVMQVIYAYNQDAFTGRTLLDKTLKKNIDSVVAAYIYNFYLLEQVANYVHQEAARKASKHLPTTEDLNVNTSIADNYILRALKDDRLYEDQLKRHLLHKVDHADFVKQSFDKLKVSEHYIKYTQKQEHTLKEDQEIIKHLYKNIFLKDDSLDHQVEEVFSNWQDDKQIITFAVINSIESYKPGKPLIDSESVDANEAYLFSNELLNKTINNEEEFVELIKPKLVNWELERIAQIDMILLKLALCELLHFTNIPVKVTLNEYIEISKTYSTPKSKDFINGILDKLVKDLKDKNKIRKTGRGLIE